MTIRSSSDSGRPASDAELILYELRRANFEPDWHLVETETAYRAHLERRPTSLADYTYRCLMHDCLASGQEAGLDIPLSSSPDRSMKRWRRLHEAGCHRLPAQRLG